MIDEFKILRAEKLIKAAVTKLSLNLKGLNILTEAGTNHFIFTPLIAYYAGASKVYVWIKDTVYGKASTIMSELEGILSKLDIPLSFFEFALNERPEAHVRLTDVITNLGFVRPLNRKLLNSLHRNAVVSYMCEAWEVRPDDVDLNFCKKRDIKIAGVWENHPELMIFQGCGALSVKLCLEAGLEVYQNNILIISTDKFGKAAANAFHSFGAALVTIVTPEKLMDTNLADFDILFVAEYSYTGKTIIGNNIQDKFKELKQVAVIHLCGAVDYGLLKKSGIFCYPEQQGFNFRMSRTLAHLGLKPVIDLHTAGLKVGELLYKNEESALVQIL